MEQTQEKQSLVVLQKKLPMLITMAVAIVLCCAVVMNFTRAWYSNNLDASAEGMQIISESPDVEYQLVIYRNGEQVYPLPEGATINPWIGLLPGESYTFFLAIKRSDASNNETMKLDIGFLGIEGYPLGTTYSIIPEARAEAEGAYINDGMQRIEIPGNQIKVTNGTIIPDWEAGTCKITPMNGVDPVITFVGSEDATGDGVKQMTAEDFTITDYIEYNDTTQTFTFPEATIEFPTANGQPIYEFTVTNGIYAYVGNNNTYKIIPENGNAKAVIQLSDGETTYTYTSSEFIATGFVPKLNEESEKYDFVLQDGVHSGQLTQAIGTVQAGTGHYSTDVFKIGYFGQEVTGNSPITYYKPLVIETGLTQDDPVNGEFMSMANLLEYFNSKDNTHQLNYKFTAGEFNEKGYLLYSDDEWDLPADIQGELSIVIPFGIEIDSAQQYKDKGIINTPSDLSNISFLVSGIYINAVPADATSTTETEASEPEVAG